MWRHFLNHFPKKLDDDLGGLNSNLLSVERLMVDLEVLSLCGASALRICLGGVSLGPLLVDLDSSNYLSTLNFHLRTYLFVYLSNYLISHSSKSRAIIKKYFIY